MVEIIYSVYTLYSKNVISCVFLLLQMGQALIKWIVYMIRNRWIKCGAYNATKSVLRILTNERVGLVCYANDVNNNTVNTSER